MRVPATAPVDVQQAFRDVWAVLDRVNGGNNWNLAGRRAINAGDAVDPSDYVTLAQLKRLAGASTTLVGGVFQTLDVRRDSVLQSLEVRQTTRLRGQTYVSQLTDAGIVFAKANGLLANDEVKFSWRYSNDSLRLGAAVVVRWHHLAELRSPSTGVLEISGEDHDVSNQFVRLVGGLADTSSPAWQRDGVNWEAKLGDASAYVTVRGSKFIADEFVANSPADYTVTNVTTDRTYDANATTLDEIADVLGTLIGDLQTLKLLV